MKIGQVAWLGISTSYELGMYHNCHILDTGLNFGQIGIVCAVLSQMTMEP